ncbi:MAG: nucleoside 2-deoxyribosyltransferase [Acidimicrobiaceae bacterium]|nr:nucleoside 2-deoxyribosyltransferase [Acidimicrobiaceae bacterium]
MIPNEENSLRQVGVYLASPLGFTTYGAAFSKRILEEVRAAGLTPNDPWSTPEGAELMRLLAAEADVSDIAAVNAAIGLANQLLIDRSSAVLACLDGSDVDSGTASEIGYASAQGKPTFGYRLDSRLAGDDVACVVNLQVEHFMIRNGGSIHRSFEAALEALRGHFA